MTSQPSRAQVDIINKPSVNIYEHEQNLLTIGSAALRKAALDPHAKQYLLSNPDLFKLLKRAADRYIGGETLDETIMKVRTSNTEGFKCSIEFMGENIASAAEAVDATTEFVLICQRIKELTLDSTISLDLSHIGLGISRDLCIENLERMCDAATAAGVEVIVSAEGHTQTSNVLDVYRQVATKYAGLAITLQAYLYRTSEDFQSLIAFPGRIRIVKGAFATPPDHAMPRGAELNGRYLSYVDQLLSSKHKCSIATHDHIIRQEAKKLVDRYQPATDTYEFESLYGIETEDLHALKAEGYNTKLYYVYGKEWYLYLCNRIAEYPLNIFRALQDIVQ